MRTVAAALLDEARVTVSMKSDARARWRARQAVAVFQAELLRPSLATSRFDESTGRARPDAARYGVATVPLPCAASFGVFALLSSGCVGDADQVKARAASDFSCNERDIAIVERREDIAEPTFEITACGHRARYSCHERHRSFDPRKNVVPGCALDMEYPATSSVRGPPASTMTGKIDGEPLVVEKATAAPENGGVRSIFLGEESPTCPDLHIAGARAVVLVMPWRDGRFDYEGSTLRVMVDHGTSATYATIDRVQGAVELERKSAQEGRLKVDLTWSSGTVRGEIDVAACP